MVKRMVVLAMALVALMATPAMAQQYPPNENLITVSDTTPCPGQSVTITAQTFTAGGAVTVKIGGAVVGTPTADANGKVSLDATIPAGQAQGAVQVTATGPAGADTPTLTVNAAVDIVACNETPATTAPAGGGGAGGGGDLPRTGSDSTMTLVRVGVAMAAVGGLLLAVSSKRRKHRNAGPAPA
jgi:LPXTG-motif cell wall-anchored protein